MATPFNRSFEFVSLSQSYDDYGRLVNGGVSRRVVRGTIQPMSGQDTVAYFGGSRETGAVKVYSSEKLAVRAENDGSTGYVVQDGSVFELVQELPFGNIAALSHFKYIGSLVPPTQIPQGVLV